MKIEDAFRQVDFSADTDLKDRLRQKLFAKNSKVVSFRRLDDDELEFVAAAKGIVRDPSEKKNPDSL